MPISSKSSLVVCRSSNRKDEIKSKWKKEALNPFQKALFRFAKLIFWLRYLRIKHSGGPVAKQPGNYVLITWSGVGTNSSREYKRHLLGMNYENLRFNCFCLMFCDLISHLIKAPRSKGNYDHRNDINIVRVTRLRKGVWFGSKKSQETNVMQQQMYLRNYISSWY